MRRRRRGSATGSWPRPRRRSPRRARAPPARCGRAAAWSLPWRGLAFGLGAASVALAAVALVLAGRLDDVRSQRDAQSQALASVLNANSRLVHLQTHGPTVPGAASLVGDSSDAVLVLPDLPRAPDGKTYEAWYLDADGKPTPAGPVRRRRDDGLQAAGRPVEGGPGGGDGRAGRRQRRGAEGPDRALGEARLAADQPAGQERVGDRQDAAPLAPDQLAADHAGEPAGLRSTMHENPITRPIAELSADLRLGKLRSSDLLENALDRIAMLDRKLESFVCLAEDARAPGCGGRSRNRSGPVARTSARRAVAVKDNYLTADMPSHAGTDCPRRALRRQTPAVVAKLREAGAVMIGKTRMHEFAWGNVTPPSKNPGICPASPAARAGDRARSSPRGSCRWPWVRTRAARSASQPPYAARSG